jgi:hypothetical protein
MNKTIKISIFASCVLIILILLYLYVYKISPISQTHAATLASKSYVANSTPVSHAI